MNVGILTVSDRCSRGDAEDTSGDHLAATVPDKFGWNVSDRACLPDEREQIEKQLKYWADDRKLNLILTTGGTGMSPRDVTPEATEAVLEKKAPGLVHQMLASSLKVTPMASSSRAAAGIRGKTLIVNLPGSKKGSSECLGFISTSLPHALDVLNDRKDKVEKTHHDLQNGSSTSSSSGLVSRDHVCPHNQPMVTNGESKVDSGKIAGRHRESPFPMITVKEAQDIVLSHCKSLGTETVYFTDGLGRVLAEDICAQDPLPPFPASVKDGYAVVTADGAGVRPVRGGSNAGSNPDIELKPGEIMRINTGGPVPRGADAVVQVEDTKLVKATEDGREELEVEILKAPTLNQDIRPVGNDIKSGEKILSKHSVIGPAEIGLLATVGALKITVFKRPTVSLLSTGNELQDPHTSKLGPGAIRDSNKSTLLALLAMEDIPSHDCGIAIDEPGVLLSKVKLALQSGDMLVTTGGVSMGDRDILREVLVQDLGATIHFARVKMKPGKPTTFATLVYNGVKKIVLGLPGNPVSATVTSHLYVLPACRKIGGYLQPFPAIVRAKLDADVRLDPRQEYRRVVLTWEPGQAVANSLRIGGCQMSSRLLSCASANGLLILPPRSDEVQEMKAGSEVDAMVFGAIRS